MAFVNKREPYRIPNKPENVRKRRPSFARQTQGLEPVKASNPAIYRKCVVALVPTNNRPIVAKLAYQRSIPMYIIKVELKVGRQYAVKMAFCSSSDVINNFVNELNTRKLILDVVESSDKPIVKQPNLYRDRTVTKRP